MQIRKALKKPGTDRRSLMDEALNNFSPRAQQVLALARKEANRFNHHFIGTEHLLLGIIALGQGTAVNVLKGFGLNLENMRTEIGQQVGTGPDQPSIGNIPYTPRVKKVLVLAVKEAQALNHTYVGTEHILIGLLREGDGVAARVLKSLDVDIERTRQAILRELDPQFALDHRRSAQMSPQAIPSVPANLGPATSNSDSIETRKRYDVYCAESDKGVVYRNALFKGVKQLFRGDGDKYTHYFELELADGQIMFIATYSVLKFCEPGATPGGEVISGE